VGLNIILIPQYGIIGAARTMLIADFFYTIVVTFYAFREFQFPIDYWSGVLYLLGAVGMYLIITSIDCGSPLRNLLMKIPVGAFSYGVLILLLDRKMRKTAVQMLGRN
jgi:hypothetical protein